MVTCEDVVTSDKPSAGKGGGGVAPHSGVPSQAAR